MHDCPNGGAGYRLVVQWCRSFNRCNDYGDWVSCSANGDSLGWAQAYADSGCPVVGNNVTGALPFATGICVPQ